MMSRTGQSHPRSSQGFTFLEIIIVVLILAALIGLSVPRFKNTFLDLQFRQSCSDFVSTLNYARQSAILNRAEYIIRLNADEAVYWVERSVEKDGAPAFEKAPGRFGKANVLPKSVSIACEKDSITFYPDGSADVVTVTFSNAIKKISISTEGSSSDVKIR